MTGSGAVSALAPDQMEKTEPSIHGWACRMAMGLESLKRLKAPRASSRPPRCGELWAPFI